MAGWIEEIGESVPETAEMKEGDSSPYLVDGDVVFAYTVKEVMSSFVTFQDGQDSLLMMEAILNVSWSIV